MSEIVPPRAVADARTLEASLRAGTDDFFNDSSLEDLRVSIRLACEFALFLEAHREEPDRYESDCAADDIRSGIDGVYLLRYSTRAMANVQWRDGDTPPGGYPEIREKGLRLFGELFSQELTTEDRFAKFIALARVQLAFMALVFR